MESPDREDIQLIARHSNWQKASVDKALQAHVYNGKDAWLRFVKWLLICLGTGSLTAGVLFFFAWNWASLHKFVKIGLIEGLVVVFTMIAVFVRLSPVVRNILLTAASVLVGVLFAVFGQIYQTGADAYDLFLVWTLAVTIWVLIAYFPPLWLLYIALVDLTIYLYAEQVAYDWRSYQTSNLIFLFNSVMMIIFLLLPRWKPGGRMPLWFQAILLMGTVTVATIGMMDIILSSYFRYVQWSMVFPVLILYTAGLLYGFKQRSVIFIAAIAFSLIVMISAGIARIGESEGALILIAGFVVASVTLLIKKLIDLQKKWNHEEAA